MFFLIIFSIFSAIFFSFVLLYKIMKFPSGNYKMNYIAKLIKDCAKTYLYLQYRVIFIVSIVVSLFIYLFLGKLFVFGFYVGAILSSIIGYISMMISVNANVRTLNGIILFGLSKGFDIAFKSGSVIGLLVISLGLFSIYFFYLFLIYIDVDIKTTLNSLIALSLGASLISIFARLGGGLFTKGADIGADLVGKLEIGISEDDFRNPAVIADNVGDNVGDCAGMAADLFETYCVTIVANMVLINILSPNLDKTLLLYPLIIGSICILSSIIGILFVKLSGIKIMFAMYRGFLLSAISSSILFYFATDYYLGIDNTYNLTIGIVSVKSLYLSFLVGIFLTFSLILITEYYTSSSFRPVKSIARSSLHGHATNIIQGLAVSMESTVLPVIFVIFSIILSYHFAGILGISIAATSMLSLSGIIISLDAYGPITDNAGGISVMAGLDSNIRSKTDILDAVGNTTKAITKGYAIGSAGLASLVLFITYTEDLNYYFPEYTFIFSLKDPYVVIGLFAGGIMPYIFSSWAIRSVSSIAEKVLIEVRRQFKDFNSIMNGEKKPDYFSVINLLTKEAIKEMILPSLIPIVFPLVLYFSIFLLNGKLYAFITLGSMLLGTIITGLFMAISMTSGGGAWDNAKKYIEDGNFGGKGSYAHKSSITGDMVGDPYKDTAGPAINPLIKIVNIVSLLLIITISNLG